MVMCTNSITCMVFDVRPQLLLGTQLVLEQMQSDPLLVLETRIVYGTQLLFEETR